MVQKDTILHNEAPTRKKWYQTRTRVYPTDYKVVHNWHYGKQVQKWIYLKDRGTSEGCSKYIPEMTACLHAALFCF